MSTLRIETPAWGEDLLKPSRYKGLYGGRGSGKSHFFAEMVVEAHILDANTKTVGIREVQKSLTHSVKSLIESKIQSMSAGYLFEVQQNCIRNKEGDGLIIFEGMNNHTSDSIKSLDGFDRAFVEEAQNISQRSLDLLRPTLRNANSELWFAWNPRHATDPVDKLLRGDNLPPGATVKRVNFWDNRHFPDVLREEMEYDRGRDTDKYLHVWEGEYEKNSEARVFKNWSVEEFDTPADASFNFGADWGFAEDPTVLIRSYIVGRTMYIDQEAYQIGCEIEDTPDLFLTVEDSENYTIVADSSRPETISHVRKHGFPKIKGSIKGPNSVKDGIEFLKNYKIVVHPRCQCTINELTHYKFCTDPLTGEILPKLEDKHNHVIDALRYSQESRRRLEKANKTVIAKPIPIVSKWRG